MRPCYPDCDPPPDAPPVVELWEPVGQTTQQYPHIEIQFCDDQGLDAGTRYITVNGVDRTSAFDYVSPGFAECGGGEEKHSNTTSVPFEIGSNTIFAQICDSADHCTSHTWYVERLPGPTPVVSLAPYNADVQDYSRCALSCFAATYTQGTTPYFSLDTPRNVVLVYNGDRADARPFVHVDVTHGGTSGDLPNYFYLKLQRVGGNNIQFLNGESELRFAPAAGAALRLGGQFSATANGMSSDSVYRINVIVGADFPGGRQEVVIGTRAIVVSRPAALGVARGWGIAGIQRLVPIADSALVVESDGSARYFLRSGAGFSSPSGDFTRLTVAGSGITTIYTRSYPDSTKVTFNYQGRMTAVINALGNANTVTYDGSGRVWLISDPLNTSSAIHYGTYGVDHIVSLNTTSTTVQANGTLTAIQDADGLSTRFVYDANLRLSRIVNRRGDTVSTVAYQAYSNLVVADSGPSITVYPSGSARPVVTFDPWQHAGVPYQATANFPYFTPPQASTVRATVTDAGGHATRFTVNNFGQPLVTSGVLNDTVTAAYSTVGLPTSVTPNMGVASSYSYNASGLPTSITIGDLVRNFSYMAYGIASRDSGDAGPVRRDTFLLSSRLFAPSIGDGPQSTIRLDQYGRDSLVLDAMGHLLQRRWFQGPAGNVSRDSAAGGRVRIYGYDASNRIAWDSVPNSPRRNIRTYDQLNRVIEVRDTVSAAPTTFGYDGLYLRVVVDPLGNRDSTYYNALGWPVVHVDATGRRDSVKYDVEGLVRWTRSRDAARVDTVRYTYDAGHRLRSRRGPYIAADTFSYSADGLVTSVSNANARVTTYASGIRRQTDSVVTWLKIPGQDSVHYVQRYAYLQSGPRRSLLDSAFAFGPGGLTFSARRFRYDTTTFSTDTLSFRGATTALDRNNDFMVPTVRLPGGESINRDFLSSHDAATEGSSVLHDSLSFDGQGRITGHVTYGSGWTLQSYDKLDRLGSRQFGSGISGCTLDPDYGWQCYHEPHIDSVRAHAYDALGNRVRTSVTDPNTSTELWSVTGTYGAGNRMLTLAGCSFAHDGNGNIIRRVCGADSTRYYWDGDGQLTSFKRSGADSVAFAYDPLGHVVRRTVNGVVASNFLWEGDNLQAELTANGAARLGEYSYYGMDQLHAFIPWTQGGAATAYGHQDALGNVRGLSNGGSVVLRTYQYDEFGALIGGTSSYSGEAYDRARWKGALALGPEAGLYYLRSRWYDTRTGRFLSEDPAGGGLNPYLFADGEPINRADPTGQDWVCDVWDNHARGGLAPDTLEVSNKPVCIRWHWDSEAPAQRGIPFRNGDQDCGAQSPSTHCQDEVPQLAPQGRSSEFMECVARSTSAARELGAAAAAAFAARSMQLFRAGSRAVSNARMGASYFRAVGRLWQSIESSDPRVAAEIAGEVSAASAGLSRYLAAQGVGEATMASGLVVAKVGVALFVGYAVGTAAGCALGII